MRGSAGANDLRQYFYNKGNQSVNNYDYGSMHAYKDTITDPSSTAFQVGAWVGSATNNGDGTVTFTITNEANENSLFGHLNDLFPGLFPNPDIGPMKGIDQTFQWTEPIPGGGSSPNGTGSGGCIDSPPSDPDPDDWDY